MAANPYPRWFTKYSPAVPPEANPYPRWLTKAGLGVFLLLAGGLLWEWFSVAVVADPKNIAGYLFGTETMLREGGTNYASPEAYAQSALYGAVFCLPIVFFLVLAIKKRTSFYQLLALISILVTGIVFRFLDA